MEAGMSLDRFRILDNLDRVVAGHFSYDKDDDAARKHADIFAAQAGTTKLDIWSGQRQIPRTSLAETDHIAPRPPGSSYYGLRRRKMPCRRAFFRLWNM